MIFKHPYKVKVIWHVGDIRLRWEDLKTLDTRISEEDGEHLKELFKDWSVGWLNDKITDAYRNITANIAQHVLEQHSS